jgi:hypothetical protein
LASFDLVAFVVDACELCAIFEGRDALPMLQAIFHGADVPSAVGAADNTLAVWFAVHDRTFIVGAVGEGKNDLTIFVYHNLIHGVFGIGTGISR